MRTFIVILSLIATAISISILIPKAHAELDPGDIFIIDAGAGTNSRGALFNVDPDTGNRTVISDFGNASQGALGIEPLDVAVAPNVFGVTFVLDPGAGTNNRGLLFSIDLATGNRTVISDFDNVSQGPSGSQPAAVALDTRGNILVVDQGDSTLSPRLFAVDRATGSRIVISDFGDESKGELGELLSGVAAVVNCGKLVARQIGTPAADNITGAPDDDVIHALGGNDTVNGLDGNDRICGGSGNDTLNGSNGRDRLGGQSGSDTLNGGARNDLLDGGPGNDTMDGGTGSDKCKGGPGNNDTASSCETTTGVP